MKRKSPVLEEVANKATEMIKSIVWDQFWDELDEFTRRRGAGAIAEIHEQYRNEVDLLLLGILRAQTSENASLILQSAPLAVRLSALVRLRSTIYLLKEIAEGKHQQSGVTVVLFSCLLSEIPDRIKSDYAYAISEGMF